MNLWCRFCRKVVAAVPTNRRGTGFKHQCPECGGGCYANETREQPTPARAPVDGTHTRGGPSEMARWDE